jgi:steroid 5-alpha reductase family enzyme
MYGSLTDYAAAFAVTQAAFLVLWLTSLLRRDASVVDFWWGPGFLAQALTVVWLAAEPLAARDAALLGLIGLWGLRLGWTLGRRRLAEGHEDGRYQALRAAWEPGFWWKSLFIVFVLQAVVQWLVALGPLSALMAPAAPLGLLGMAGIAIALAGFGLETVADAQLDRFKRDAAPDALCDTGLRAHLRHPNYLGEIVFWIGIGLIGLEAGAWAAALSPMLIAIFLTGVSGAPILDDRLSATRPGYAAYRARVPGFLPGLRPQVRDG